MYQIIKKISFIASFSALLALSACDSGAAKEESKPLKVGIVHCCVTSDSFMYNVASIIRDEATKANATVNFVNAEGSQERQFSDLKNMVASKPDVVLVSRIIDNETHDQYGQNIVKLFEDAQIPIVFYVLGLKNADDYENTNAYYAGSNPPQSGIIQAEMIMRHFERNPGWDKNGDGVLQYVILKGPIGNPDAEARTKWVTSTLANYPTQNIKIQQLDLKVCNWERQEAYDQMNAWLDDAKIADQVELVIANNDDMALGAIAAMQDRNMPVLPVYGVDALPSALDHIRRGLMRGTVLQDGAGQAKAAWQLAYNLGTKRSDLNANLPKRVVQNQVLLPYIAIDGDNVNDYINN